MKFNFDKQNPCTPDPFIFFDNGTYYIYVTSIPGVEAYSASSLDGVWHYEGVVFTVEGGRKYWAPSVIKTGGKYYMYVSCSYRGTWQYLRVAESDTPLGPFFDRKILFDRFTIDSHVVETKSGLFLFYAENDLEAERPGTRVYVDKLLDPITPANLRREIITPTIPQEETGWDKETGAPNWHTIEGPFWFREGEWQYVMYSSGSFMDDTYHVGYVSAKSDETDLTRVNFVKHEGENGAFDPVLFRNETEEGTGHNSVIKIGEDWFAVYHARDIGEPETEEDTRTARFCKLIAKDGILTAKLL